jgi:hypothetical protein
MKARELDPNLYPQKEVIKAYEEVGQEYEWSVHDRVYQQHFYPKVTGNAKLKEQEIEYKIDALHRLKDSKGEWLTYHVSLFGNDWEGNRIDYSYMAGMIEGIPTFYKKIDPQTDEVIPNTTQVLELKTIYTIPFSKAKVNELQKHFSPTVGFIVKDRDIGGKRYTCNLEEFRDFTYEELIDIKTGFRDYIRQKRQDQLQKAGVK